MSGIWLPGGALVLSIYLVVLFFLRGSVKNYETIIYKKLILINLFYSSFGVIIYLFAMLVGHLYLTGVLQSFYLIMMDLMILFLLKYVIELNKFNKKISKIMNMLFNIITTIVVLFILALPMDTIIEGETVDLNGPAYYAAMVEVILYIFLLIVFCISLYVRSKDSRSKLLPFVILFVFFIIALILRSYYPEVITETFIFTLSYLVMFHTIENPDLRIIKQLTLARDQAERANNAKSDFLSSMSHEIRTPLNAIVGFSEDIQSYKGEISPEIVEDADYIMEASKTLLEIVGNILDINKIESNKMEIIEVNYNFRKEVESLAKIDATRIGEKNINFKMNIAPDIPYELVGDKSKVKEIINNLLTNAIKYTEQGEIELTVKCINQNDICNLIISVRDTGRGIKKENIDKLFTKFERLDEKNSTTEGTGLGLAITKKLVELMHGSINVQSIFGEGSIFMVNIPQKINKMYNDNEEETTESDEADYGEKSVLIVDDNKLNLKVAKKALEDFDFNLDEAEDGNVAIEKVKNNHYDLILMDIMMPRMDGETALKKLKEDPSFNIPVVAVTADAVSGAEEKYIKEGFAFYLAKPFKKDQVKIILDKVFEKKKIKKNIDWEKEDVYVITDKTVDLNDIISEIKPDEGEKIEDKHLNKEYLLSCGVNLDSALELLGDMDMYNETMKTYKDDSLERIKKLEIFLREKDMENYAIEVHALKSDSKYLGFMSLADIAFEHEKKSKENDYDYIKDHFEELINEYEKYKEIMNNYL